MSRYIDADKMISDTKAMKQIAEGISIDGIMKYLEENSLTDVVQIVRCKDCKYAKKSKTVLCVPDYSCLKTDITCLDADDFCSYGERKDEGK